MESSTYILESNELEDCQAATFHSYISKMDSILSGIQMAAFNHRMEVEFAVSRPV
jgi:hypothetical protein